MLTIGRHEIRSVVTGTFRLDGGAMYGIVPKTLWSKGAEPDDQNRIPLATRTLLAVDRQAGRIILTDTGCGTKWSPENAERFAIRHDGQAVTRALHAVGATENDVTDVFVTHLHFDHNGGLTDWADQPGGATTPRYPKARHWLHRKQWDHAHDPTPKDRASYLPEDFEAIAEAGLFHFVDGDAPPSPLEGVEWFLSHGHTPYQLLPVFVGDGVRLVFTGDVVPTVGHLRPPWVMAYDLYPLTTIAEKQWLYERAIRDGWLLAFPHDPKLGGVALDGVIDRPVVARTLDL